MEITYCIESRRDDEVNFTPNYRGFSSKEFAINFAKNNNFGLHLRVVEQHRKVIKVFSADNKEETKLDNTINRRG